VSHPFRLALTEASVLVLTPASIIECGPPIIHALAKIFAWFTLQKGKSIR